jgi:hypothetical protein
MLPPKFILFANPNIFKRSLEFAMSADEETWLGSKKHLSLGWSSDLQGIAYACSVLLHSFCLN